VDDEVVLHLAGSASRTFQIVEIIRPEPNAVIDDPLMPIGPSTATTSLDFTLEELDVFLSRKGGVAQVETFLREVAAAAGYQRLGKNIRADLEAALFKLQRMGRLSISGGVIRCESKAPSVK
jgi:hypothetical protein